MKIENVRGFKDYTGKEAKKLAEMKKILVSIFEQYGFEPAETPVIEYENFVKGENQRQDEAISDIFKLRDKGKRRLALRYEFTFQLKRLMKNKKFPYRRYQIGKVFRDEPVSSNRLKQFTQCDADIIGLSDSGIKEEAEILALSNDILKKFEVKPVILINNRKLLNEILDDLKIKEKDKEQVLREIDKYDKLSEKEVRENLRKLGAEKVINSLKQGKDYFNKFESYKEIVRLMEYCKAYNVDVKFAPSIVRGLSYYKGNIFEIKAEVGDGISKESIVAGGSYVFNDVKCTGISFGLERLSAVAELDLKEEKILVISLEQDEKAIEILQKLRNAGKSASIYYGKPSKALEYANSYNFSKVIFVGEKEVKSKKYKIKYLETGKEKNVSEKRLGKL